MPNFKNMAQTRNPKQRKRRSRNFIPDKGEKKEEQVYVQVRPGYWVISSRKPAQVKAEHEAKHEKDLEALRSKIPGKKEKHEWYLGEKAKKAKR